MQVHVSLKDVAKSYRRGKISAEVLHNINLDIGRGEFLALMGPSGSGKTTLLNLVGGLDVPTAGRVIIDGHSIGDLSAGQLARWRAANVGFVFQFYNLMPTLSAAQNIELPLLLTKLSPAQRRRHVEAALELVGLTGHAKHRPSELSGGQQQRVAIARAMASDPCLLICDEPTGDLDRATADEVLELMRELGRGYGKTIIMVTHDPQAAEYASRRLHLDKGLLTDVEGAIAA